MSKPILDITVQTIDKKTQQVSALFDTGSFYTIIREDALPKKSKFIFWYQEQEQRNFGTASKGGELKIKGATQLVLDIGDKKIEDTVLISSELKREMIIGAGTMQKWDITVFNEKGKTVVFVRHDMRDPEINEVD